LARHARRQAVIVFHGGHWQVIRIIAQIVESNRPGGRSRGDFLRLWELTIQPHANLRERPGRSSGRPGYGYGSPRGRGGRYGNRWRWTVSERVTFEKGPLQFAGAWSVRIGELSAVVPNPVMRAVKPAIAFVEDCFDDRAPR
jgi:hypothetical protein